MSDGDQTRTAPREASRREDRLGQALRANLRRRKAAAAKPEPGAQAEPEERR